MAERITRESWNLIAENIVNIVNDHNSSGNLLADYLEEYLTDEGIIEVMKE